MFVRLGLINSLRQLGRSLLVLIAMTLSAISLTSALSYSQVSTRDSYQFYRTLLGGEILVSPVRWAGQQLSDITADTGLKPIRLQKTGLSWLEAYYPELYRDGFLGVEGQRTSQVIPAMMLNELLHQPGISGYSLQHQLPASMTNAFSLKDRYTNVTVLPLPEPARLAELLNTDVSLYLELIERGQPFALVNTHLEVDQQVIVEIAATILDSEVSSTSEEVRPTPEQIYQRKLVRARQKARAAMEIPSRDQVARLQIPLLTSLSNGDYLPDYSQTFEIEVPVVNNVSIVTRSITYQNEQGDTMVERGYLHGGYVWLPQDLWIQLWQQASSGGNLPLNNLVLQVENMDLLARTVGTLQAKYPQFTFVSVADFAYRMENGEIIDRFYNVPSTWYRPGETRLAVPIDLSKLMGVLFYLIAGMLIASRMLTGSTARRQEIGVLKALGARRKDIVAMAISESLVVTLIGASAGFLLVRMGGVIIELGNNVPWMTVLARTWAEYAQVVGLASLVSLLFSLLPALQMSNLTVMGVLRGE